MNGSQLYEAIVNRDFQLYIWEWGVDYPDPDAVTKPFAHSDSVGDNATIKAVAWWCRYINLETSKLVEQASWELNREKRIAIYKKITDIILNDGPFVFLYSKIHQYGIRSEISDSIKKPAISWYYFPALR